MTTVATRPEILLTNPANNGTIAAARALGRAGLPVVMAGHRPFAPALWSRYVERVLRCPDLVAEPERFLEWLLDLGAREPGRVLYPTSDDVAWLYARHRDELARHYRLSSPSFDTVAGLLDKWRLEETCARLGIDTPATWLPRSESDLERIARDVRFPLVIKPRSQAFLSPPRKGRIVRDRSELVAAYREFCSSVHHAQVVVDESPDVVRPVVQAFADEAKSGIYNLSGYVDASGALLVVEASRKVLQWPRQLGIGLCFEAAPVLPELVARVERLCRSVAYHGVFEVEFLESPDRHLLIDFNPRFFGQMAFDISRGLDLPALAYFAALGDRDEVDRLVQRAHARTHAGVERAYCNRVDMETVLAMLHLAGRMSSADCATWHEWLARRRMTDAVLDQDDWLPGALVATFAVFGRLAHPRSTWRAARTG